MIKVFFFQKVMVVICYLSVVTAFLLYTFKLRTPNYFKADRIREAIMKRLHLKAKSDHPNHRFYKKKLSYYTFARLKLLI